MCSNSQGYYQSQMDEGIQSQREEVVKAFVAKHGMEPDECEQVIQTVGDTTTWSLMFKEKQ